jgi:hypothetical protein
MSAFKQNTGVPRAGFAQGLPMNGATKSVAPPNLRAANSPAAPLQGAGHAGNTPIPAGVATPAKRDATFDQLSRMFRRAGTDVTAQALFRAVLEYRVESLEKDK